MRSLAFANIRDGDDDGDDGDDDGDDGDDGDDDGDGDGDTIAVDVETKVLCSFLALFSSPL